jgi:hypothetical protein
MNKNRFKTDGFSTPETQKLYESWSEQLCEQLLVQETLCGYCRDSRFVSDGEWVVCLSADSPYCYETLCSWFTCPSFARRPDPPQAKAP